MENAKKKAKKSPATKLIIFGICAVLAVVTPVVCIIVSQQITLAKCDDLAEEKQQMITDAKLEQEKLQDELEKAGTDEYKEQVARDELGLVKANERVYIDISQK